jgi:hypothetical protein
MDIQFGFLPNRGIQHCTTGIKALDDEFRKRRKHLHIVFLDLSQAYDSVNRTKLFEVLRVFYKVDPQLVQQLEALYTDNTGTHPASLAPPPAASTSPRASARAASSPRFFSSPTSTILCAASKLNAVNRE